MAAPVHYFITMIDLALPQLILAQYRVDLDGLHGIFHWARVMENGAMLAESNGGRPDVVEYFALLHDSQRFSNGGDHQHGPRAADFIQQQREAWIPLDRAGFDLLEYAVRYHTDGRCDSDPTIQACWDADRLDLARAAITPNPAWMCTDKGRDAQVIAWANQRAVSDYVAASVLERWGIDWRRYRAG